MGARANLLIQAGDTWWSNPFAILRGGEAVDLTDGWDVRAQARARRNSEEIFYEWTLEDQHVLLGTAFVTPAGSDTAIETSALQLFHEDDVSIDWPNWVGVFDIEISHPDEDPPFVRTVAGGSVRVIRDVTRTDD